MKKYLSVLMLVSAIVLSACSTNDSFDSILAKSNQSEIGQDYAVGTGSGCIVPLDSTCVRKKVQTRAYNDNDVSEELSQLDEVPIYLQVAGNTSNLQFLSASSQGKELSLAAFNEEDEGLQFYLKILPATVGIPYLIYSTKTKTPISIGAYSNAPDVKVVYAMKESTTSLFGASWDIKKADYSTDAYILESQDYPRQGSSGNWYDIYYSVITANGAKLSLEKYSKMARQEFRIIPVEKFNVESVEFDTDAGVLNKVPNVLYSEKYTNKGPIAQTYSFKVQESYSKSSSFNKKTSYNVSVPTEIKTRVPFIAEGKITTSVSGGQEFTYGKTEAKTVTISREYPVSVPANYTAQLSVVFYKYNMDVDYVATCVGVTSGRRIKIKGKWSGVDAQFVDAVLNLTPIDSSTASSRKIIITKQMLDSGKIIKVE